jgi:hypothetical protein
MSANSKDLFALSGSALLYPTPDDFEAKWQVNYIVSLLSKGKTLFTYVDWKLGSVHLIKELLT